MLRYIVFLIFIIVGFILSGHKKLYPIVAAVYGIALFYYTFLSRMELVSATTSVVISKPAPAVKQSWYIKALYEIFRMKTNSYHEAFILNIMLFVPMGYLIPALLHRHAGEKGSAVHRWLWTVLICSAVSITIEILQQLTGFGMFDWNDWIANTVGSLLGVLVLYAYQRVHA